MIDALIKRVSVTYLYINVMKCTRIGGKKMQLHLFLIFCESAFSRR
jgi:hypothetical protein